MIRITLACASGMSTSLLLKRMKSAAETEELDIAIISVSETQFEDYLNDTDILLLGPQVSFLEEKYQKLFKDTNKKVTSIPILEFGRMDGEKVLERALLLFHGGI